jgi:hypothetical protein
VPFDQLVERVVEVNKLRRKGNVRVLDRIVEVKATLQAAMRVVLPNPAGATINVNVRFIPSLMRSMRRVRSTRLARGEGMDVLVRRNGSMMGLYIPSCYLLR